MGHGYGLAVVVIPELSPAGPLDVIDVLRSERAAFVELLRSLGDPEWRLPTECPAYDVKGIATHILGDDFSLLSRQRDGAPNGLLAIWEPEDDFRTALDRFNDGWVGAAHFFSPELLIDLLEGTGRATADWYAGVDPESPGEPVGFFGATGPSPYWQIAAREYVERWAHHHQVRRAVGRPGLLDDIFLLPAAEAIVRAFGAHLRSLGAPPGASVVLSVHDLSSWTFVSNGDGWDLFDGRPGQATAGLGLERSLATPVLSRALAESQVEASFSRSGDLDLARRAARGIAALTAH